MTQHPGCIVALERIAELYLAKGPLGDPPASPGLGRAGELSLRAPALDRAPVLCGRALVYLWLSGGTFFNASLVAEGYAVPLTIAPNVEHADLFRRLAARARSADRGLWSPTTCGGETGQPAGGSTGGGGGSTGGGSGGSGGSGGGGCEPGYDPCVPRYPPDVDCADVDGPIQVSGSAPHGLDGDGDGIGCE